MLYVDWENIREDLERKEKGKSKEIL